MKKHFLYVPFTGLGLYRGYRGDKWLKNRIQIFKQFVLPSIQKQTNQNFTLWVSWRPEEISNPIVEEFGEFLNNVRELDVIFTYGGVMFWDDKYDNDNLLERLKKTLPALTETVGDADLVYMTIQPSDDMYFSTMVERVQKIERGAIGFRNGYIMNLATKEIAEYNPDTNPPFYTIVFDKDIFLDPIKHYNFIGPYKSHEYVKDFMPYEYFVDRGFIVGTHGENISTTWNHPYRGRILTKEEADSILSLTGNLLTEPIIIQERKRLIARKILNKLPFQDGLRKFYHKLPEKFKKL